MCSGGIVLFPATIRCTQSRTDLLKRKCACNYHMQREYRDILYLLFFSIYIIIIGFSGNTRLLPTISRLFADYSATALRLFRAQPESRAGICTQFRKEAHRSSGRKAWRQECRSSCGRRRHGGQQEAPREPAGTGDECGAVFKRCGEHLYLRGNCPLNARLCFRGIPIYLRYKHAVYARFRGYFAGCKKTPRECACIRQGGRYSGGALELQPLGDVWSWRQKKSPDKLQPAGVLIIRGLRGSNRVLPPRQALLPRSCRRRTYLELLAALMSISSGISTI